VVIVNNLKTSSMAIMKLYKYMYYRLYAWNLRVHGKRDMPQWNALLGVSFVMAANLFFLTNTVLTFIFKADVPFLLEALPKKTIVLCLLVLLATNYFIFVHKGKYKATEEKYKDEPLRKKRINMVLLYLYFLVSLVLPVLPVFIWRYINFGVWFL